MKTATAAMKAAIAEQTFYPATAWLCELENGTVLAFTDHDFDFDFDLESFITAAPFGYGAIPGIDGTGMQTYRSTQGYDATDVENVAGLSVSNMEVHGILSSPSITEDDLRAGLWDFCRMCVFLVNWNDLTMGPIIEKIGTLGAVTCDGGMFRAEFRGLAELYKTTIGWLTSPMCRYDFGDTFCTVDLNGSTTAGPITVAGFLDGASEDGLVLFASDRTEPGPTGGIAITAISNADPCVITLADPVPFSNGQAVTLSGIIGPEDLNGSWTARNPSGNTFEIAQDTTSDAAYVGGGEAVALGGNTGYFDGGQITILTGANAGHKREVKSYTVGQITLHLPFPYSFVFDTAGVSYSMHRGCNKSETACKEYNNYINFGGEPKLPGIDKVVQVARHNG